MADKHDYHSTISRVKLQEEWRNKCLVKCLNCKAIVVLFYWETPFCEDCRNSLTCHVWMANHDGKKIDLREMYPHKDHVDMDELVDKLHK